ncbi:hypothetical protein RKD39_004387 [Streptomyces albogriseolus]
MAVLETGRRLPLHALQVRHRQGAGAGGGLGVLRLPVPLQPDPLPVEAHRAVPGGHGQRQGRAGQQIAGHRPGRDLLQQQRGAYLLREVLGDAVAVGLHDQLVRVVRLGEAAAGRVQQGVGAVAQPQPEPPRLLALLQ